MNKQAVSALLSASLLLCSLPAVAGAQAAPGQAATAPATQSQADADWAIVAKDFDNRELNQKTFRMNVKDMSMENWRWNEVHLRAYRDDGLAFWDHYPNDPRRYEWLIWTVNRSNQLYYFKDIEQGAEALHQFFTAAKRMDAPVDEDAIKAWKLRYPALKAELLASSVATESQKCQLTGNDIFTRLTEAGWVVRNGGTPELSKIEDDILAYGAKYGDARTRFPEVAAWFGGYYPDSLARNIVMVKPLPSEFLLPRPEVPAFLSRLKSSSNPKMVEFAIAEGYIDKLRANPLQLRCVAVDGTQVDLSKLRGKVVLVEFSAITWCGACQHLRPILKDLYAKYHDQGLEIVTVLLDSDKDKNKIVQVLKKDGDLWPNWITGSTQGNDFTKKLGVSGVPYTLFLDKSGLLAYDVVGGEGTAHEAMIRRLLASPTPSAATAK